MAFTYVPPPLGW